MAITNSERTIRDLHKLISDNRTVLPNFQRGFVWDRKKQKSFVASVLVDLPIGSLLILEGKNDDFSKRRLCYPSEITISANDCSYVLDGQQRLSTQKSVFFDLFIEEASWESSFEQLFGQLRTRWFLRVIPEENEADLFSYRTLSEPERFSKLTDSEIEDFIEFRVVHKNKIESHHPQLTSFRNKKSQLDDKETVKQAIPLAATFAKEGLVPLWELYLGNSGLHKRVLDDIAKARIEELKKGAEERLHDSDYYEAVFEPLDLGQGEVSALIEGLSQDDRERELAQHWADLKSAWVNGLKSQLEGVLDRNMAIIYMTRDEVDRAVAIFEAINRGGSPLSVYDLIVAKSAQSANEKNLSTRIVDEVNAPIDIPTSVCEKYVQDQGKTKKASWNPANMKVVDGNEPSSQYKDWFINILSLIVYTKEKEERIGVDHIKKGKHLTLTTSDVNSNASRVVTALNRALAFLHLRCGVVSASDISYKLMVVVLAYHLDSDSIWKRKSDLDRIEYWYWASLLGGTYYAKQNERCIKDLEMIVDFLKGNHNTIYQRKNSVLDYSDYATRDILLRIDKETPSEQKSVRSGILQFILSRFPRDFAESATTVKPLTPWTIANGDVQVDLHHVVPLATVTRIGETSGALRAKKDSPLNSVLNLTFISREANQKLRDKTPVEYINFIGVSSSASHFLPEKEHFRKAIQTDTYVDILDRRLDLIKTAIMNHLTALVP